MNILAVKIDGEWFNVTMVGSSSTDFYHPNNDDICCIFDYEYQYMSIDEWYGWSN